MFQTAHKSLIKPIAFKPIASTAPPPSRYGPRNQQHKDSPPPPRPSPPQAYSDVMKTPSGYTCNNNDDGYISQEYHSHTNSSSSSLPKPGGLLSGQPSPAGVMSPHDTSNSAKGHAQQDTTPKVTYLTDSGQKMVASTGSSSHADSGRPESFNSSSNLSSRISRDSSTSLQQHSATTMDCSFIQTPSPSDSGLGELEAIIRDKDAQIRQLRDTMERNETAILQVCEEKEQNWEIRFRELHSDWEKKLRLQQQKAFKMEQALLMQLFKLQQERKSTRLEIETMRTETERAERHATGLQDEVKVSKTKLEETQWDMCQKVGEISHLKAQVKETKDNLVQKSNELLSVKAQLKEAQRDNGEKNGEILGLESELKKSQEALKDMRKELDNMESQFTKFKSSSKVQESEVTSTSTAENSPQEVRKLQEELAKLKTDYEADKDRWLAEKDKVIRYQRHLQLNYVQMANKNKMLEAEVQQLTLELEGRDICLEGAKIEGEGEESMC